MNSHESSPNARNSEAGVLANLPRTRPQRATARRAAARRAPRETPSGAAPLNGSGARGSTKRARKDVASNGAGAESSAGAKANATSTAKQRAKPTRASAATVAARRRRAAETRERHAQHEELAPRQGFECEGETSRGSLQPPGGAELVATAAELVGELAKASLSTGERLFKDVLSRLPLS